MNLNLGASDRTFDGYLSVDIVPPADVVADLSKPWPWPDSSVDAVIAFDIIEHISDRIHFMNELHRVMKNGSFATIEVPNACKGAGYFQYPTHKSPWVMNSFQYFENGSPAHARFAKAYGITARFDVMRLTESSWQEQYEITWKIHAVLRAVK